MIELTNCRITLGKGSQRGPFIVTVEDDSTRRIIAEINVPEDQAAALFGHSRAAGSVRLYADTTERVAVLGRETQIGHERIPDHVAPEHIRVASHGDPWAIGIHHALHDELWAAAQTWADARAVELGAAYAHVGTERDGQSLRRIPTAHFTYYGEATGRAETPEGG